ncbi:MAG: permease-like cell division protein FtsX [bacterium]|nr:permease-like cell division protein FtsX [bacterium]
MAQKKQNSKVIMEQKRRRRAVLTFGRILKYGGNSFLRNAWLSVAATAVMTITLLIVFSSYFAGSVLKNTVDGFRDKVDMSIYLKKGAKDEDVKKIEASLKKLTTVKEVSYVSAEQAKEKLAVDNADIEGFTEALSESGNEFFGRFNVKMVDIGNTSELKNFVESDKTIKSNLNPNHPPTYASKRKEVIDNLSNSFNFVEKVGLVAAVIFTVISGLIIFNTIRMAIFNRREEIYMMKLIGANRSFISGPFLVESVICGILASIFATGLGYAIVNLARPKLETYGIAISADFGQIGFYLLVVLPILMLIGAVIGVLSSIFATRKYLKI